MMKKRHSTSKNTIILLIVLLLIGIGIAYAVLTEQLTINNTVSYDAMKWEVGFSNTEDNGGTITSTSSIKNEGKSITVNCDFGKSTTQQSCIVKATITNNGTFDIGLASDPIITYDDTYIHTLTFKWEDHPTYLNSTVLERGFVEKGTSQNVILTIKTKNLTKDMLPSEGISIPVTITLDFEEWQEDTLPKIEDLAILVDSGCHNDISEGVVCGSDSFVKFIGSGVGALVKTINFQDKIDLTTAEDYMDISASQNGSVMLVAKTNEEYSTEEKTYADLYIQSDTQLYANENMTAWFGPYTNLIEINGLELLDTSMTKYMGYMFLEEDSFLGEKTGYSVSNLDLSNFDTSNVIEMSGMFLGTGFSNETFTLDVSNFDTSNVTNMAGMFLFSGYKSKNFTLDVSNFDTSEVTYMNSMFESTGYTSSSFTLDVCGFDTSQVTNMDYMFHQTGYNNTNFSLNLSKFDMRNVIDTNYMLSYAGYSSTNFITSITITNPNTSYTSMFDEIATQGNSQITVNYTSETSDLVDKMIATKSEGSNVVKGIQVD